MKALITMFFIGLLSISGCTTTVTEYKLISPDIQVIPRPEKPLIKNVQFDQENNVITLTLKSYENLINNLTEILKQTKNLENILDYYEQSIKSLNNE